jgi:hypothetical protein
MFCTKYTFFRVDEYTQRKNDEDYSVLGNNPSVISQPGDIGMASYLMIPNLMYI